MDIFFKRIQLFVNQIVLHKAFMKTLLIINVRNVLLNAKNVIMFNALNVLMVILCSQLVVYVKVTVQVVTINLLMIGLVENVLLIV